MRETNEGRLERKKREGWRAVTCGVGMEQCSPRGAVVSCPPSLPRHPTPLTASPFFSDTAAGRGGMMLGGEVDDRWGKKTKKNRNIKRLTQ